MNLGQAAELILLLKLNDQVSKGLKEIQGNVDKTTAKMTPLNAAMYKIGAGIGLGIKNAAKIGVVGIGLLVDQVGKGIDSLVELEDVTLQTNAVIESTGSAAGISADDVRTLAEDLEDLTGVDDKVIQKGENLLLTFTKIGKEGFEPAMQAALDMSQAMDQDLQTSILQIGKALNNPDEGLAALTRVGVNFDEATKKIIEDMVAVGDTAGAQQIIIGELNKEFGGSAQASMMGYRGTQIKLKDTVEDLQMALAEALLPAIKKVSEKLTVFLKDKEVREGIRKLGESIAGLFSDENLKGGGDAIKGLFTFLKELPWNQIKDGMSFAAESAKKVVDVFRSLPPGVQAGLLTFLAANKLSAGMLGQGLGALVGVALNSLKTITAANVTVIGANVTGGGSVPGAPTPGGGVGPAGLLVRTAGVVTVAAVGAGLIVQGVAEVGNAAMRANGLAEREIELHNINNSLTGDLQTALKRGADPNSPFVTAITSKLAANNAELALIKGSTLRLFGPLDGTNIGVRNLLGPLNNIPPEVRHLVPNLIAGVSATNSLKPKLDTLVGKTDAEIARMDQISKFTGISSRKDLSVSIDLKTTFQVSAREVANQIKHIDFLQDRGGD